MSDDEEGFYVDEDKDRELNEKIKMEMLCPTFLSQYQSIFVGNRIFLNHLHALCIVVLASNALLLTPFPPYSFRIRLM